MENNGQTRTSIDLFDREWFARTIPAPVTAVIDSEQFRLVPERDGDTDFYIIEGSVTVTLQFPNGMTATVSWEDDQFEGLPEPKDTTVRLNGRHLWDADGDWLVLIDRDPILDGDEDMFRDEITSYAWDLVPKDLFVVELPLSA